MINGMLGGIAYALQVCVHGRPVVEVFQPAGDISQLKSCVSEHSLKASSKSFTSLSRLVPGHAVTKSMIVPCSIHSETINMVDGVFFAPTSCSKFGCWNCFHKTTSQQNLCPGFSSDSR